MKKTRRLLVALAVVALLYGFHQSLLSALGGFLVSASLPAKADAAVVLYTGVDLTARLIEAAALYRDGTVDKIVINGGRKDSAMYSLEARGFRTPADWYAEPLGILRFLGVARGDIVIIAAPDAYDTLSEALSVGERVLAMGMDSVIITTSKFHTRRAGYVWRALYADRLAIAAAAARSDPFDPEGWWRSGRQIRQLMAEYGAWVYYFWKRWLADSHETTNLREARL